MTYEWDPVKAAANAKKHRVTFEGASSVFLDPLALTFWDHDRPFGAATRTLRGTRGARGSRPDHQRAAGDPPGAQTV